MSGPERGISLLFGQGQDLPGLIGSGDLTAQELCQRHDLGHQLAVGGGLAAPL